MSQPSDLQKDIIEFAKDNPDSSFSEIAAEVGCSPSWVRETISEYLNKIIGENDLSGVSVTKSFSEPYVVYASETIFRQTDLETGDPVKLEISDGTRDTYTSITEIKPISELDKKEEIQKRIYALESISGDLPEKYVDMFSQFDRGDSDELEIYSASDFSDFLRNVQAQVESIVDSSELIVGVGLFRQLGEDYETILSPDHITTRTKIKNSLSEGPPKVVDIRSPEEDSTRPDTVYFTYREDLAKDRFHKDLLNKKYHDLEHLRPHGSFVSTLGPHLIDTSSRIVEVDEENIKYVQQQFQIAIFDQSELSFEDLINVTEDLSIIIDDDEYSVSRNVNKTDNYEQIIFFIGTMSILSNYSSGTLLFMYPSEPEIIENFIYALIDNIEEAEDISIHLDEPEKMTSSSSRPLVTENDYVLDTNSIYNNVHDGEPTSMLRTFFNNTEMYKSTIIIPWPVLYEINKHKDRGGPGPRVQEQGIENLRLLELLDNWSFVDLDVKSISSSKRGEITQSDVADMEILERAQDENAVLISGDGRLRNIADISNVPAVNIKDLVEVNNYPDPSEDIAEKVLPKIGTEIEYREEIIEAISQELSKIQQSKRPDMGEIDENPEEYISDWINNGDIVPIIKEGPDGKTLAYDRGNVIDLVITPTATREIADCIVKFGDNDEPYLSKEFLKNLTQLAGISDPGLPMITFHAPISNVVGPQSASLGGLSTNSCQLYQIKEVKNANYESEELSEATSRDEYVHDAVLLARENDYPLLCSSEDDYLQKIAGLLDVNVSECRK